MSEQEKSAAAEMDRVGDFVRRALPRELARRGIPWMHEILWTEEMIG